MKSALRWFHYTEGLEMVMGLKHPASCGLQKVKQNGDNDMD
jgi:hypothetical protein